MINMSLEKLIQSHQKKKAFGTLVVHPNDHPYDSDQVAIAADGRVTDLYRKPHPPEREVQNLATTGVFAIEPGLVQGIPADRKMDLVHDVMRSDPDSIELREAIAAANTDAVVDGCTAGDGADTIVFGGSVLLPNVTLNQDGFVVTSQISIDGALLLGTITLDGDNRYRIFDVSTSGDLTLSNMTLTRGGRVDRGGAVLVREGARFSASIVASA